MSSQQILGSRNHYHVAGLVSDASARVSAVRACPGSPCVYRIARRFFRAVLSTRQLAEGRAGADLFQIPPEAALGRIATDDPEEEQTPGDVKSFAGGSAVNQPPQSTAVPLEVVTHTMPPLRDRGSQPPLSGQEGFSGAIAHQALQGVVAFACRREHEGRVHPHGLERVTYKTDDVPLRSRFTQGGSCQENRPRRGELRGSRSSNPHDRQGPPRLPESKSVPAARRAGGTEDARWSRKRITLSRRPSH